MVVVVAAAVEDEAFAVPSHVMLDVLASSALVLVIVHLTQASEPAMSARSMGSLADPLVGARSAAAGERLFPDDR